MKRRHFMKASSAVVLAAVVPNLSCAEKKPNWQLGCYTRPWAKFDYREALDEITKAGFKYVGLMTTNSKTNLVISKETTEQEALQIAEEVKQRNLTVASVWGGNFDVKESLQAGKTDLKNIINSCFLVGAKSLLIGGTGDKDLFEFYYQAVAECCDDALKKGVELALKPHGGLNTTGPQCRDIIKKVNHPNFRLWYDPGNIYYYTNGELDPVVDSPSVNGLVTGMCIKDYLHPKNVAITPGTGLVKFTSVIDNLQKGGFVKGPLLIEVLKPGTKEELLLEATKAKEFLTNILA